MQALVWTNYDKFHRLVRDMKLSFKYAAKGLFLKTQLFTSFIWSLNYKPFNSGAFFTKKQRLLDVFLSKAHNLPKKGFLQLSNRLV